MTSHAQPRRLGKRSANRGVILVIALIVLVAMTLGGIAILRSVDSTTLIAGNLAFKQRTLYAADAGVSEAMTWLLANKPALANDSAANGYYSSQAFDWTNASAWSGAKQVTGGQDAGGNTVTYIIHRMCTCANTAYNGTCTDGQANQCAMDSASTAANPRPLEGDTFTIGGIVFPSSGSLYYRVTVRGQGPRNTEAYIQAMLTLTI
jgi:type IV pilus assembly protein PilX